MTPLRVHVSQLPGGAHNADRVVLTPNAAIVLDGASAFVPVEVDPGTYAEVLGRQIAVELSRDPDITITDAVAAAIRDTVDKLTLHPEASPSSTVTVLRTRPDAADLYVLGDSPIHYGTPDTSHVLTDDRLGDIAAAEREYYVSRLRAGHGYDDDHRAALVALQQVQRQARNQPGGYWIAETNPDAAHHGITRTLAPDAITWAVLATDGAADYIDHTGQDWRVIAHQQPEQLSHLLAGIHEWEAVTDPDGRTLPRAKRHDDKTIAAIPNVF